MAYTRRGKAARLNTGVMFPQESSSEFFRQRL